MVGRGDLLCVYTDGVSEALDAADEEFGLDRLTALVAAGTGPEELTATVFDAVEAFAATCPSTTTRRFWSSGGSSRAASLG